MNNVLLIGKGYWGKNWYNTLLKKSISFAVIEPKLENGADQNGIPIYKTLEEVDIPRYTHAIVATHVGQHVGVFNHLTKCGMAPGHILMEKPCGSSWMDAEQLHECYPGYIQLHSEAFKYINQNIKKIGTPHLYKSIRASMGPRIRTDCSVVADYMIHDLYLFIVLFQPFHAIQVVSKQVMNRLVSHGNDTAFINLYNPDVHILADMFASWWYPFKERQVIISGDRGSFIWINDELYFNESRYEQMEGIDSYGNFGYELINVSDARIELPNNTAMENELDDLLTGRFSGSRIYIQPVWDLIKKIKWHTRYRY
jgi:predicted dehydrogenase